MVRPRKASFRHRDSLKGLLPYIRAVCAVGAAAHDGYSRSGFLSAIRTQSTSQWPECPRPGLTFIPSLLFLHALLQNGSALWLGWLGAEIASIMHPE